MKTLTQPRVIINDFNLQRQIVNYLALVNMATLREIIKRFEHEKPEHVGEQIGRLHSENYVRFYRYSNAYACTSKQFPDHLKNNGLF